MNDIAKEWSIAESGELYEINNWGKGFFFIGENGRVHVRPDRKANKSLDLKELVDRLQARGLNLPVLIRFNDILKDRIQELAEVFSVAIKDHDYKGSYRCVYPIKVNQQREIVEKIIEYGKPYGFGLEAGSKPELLAVIAMTDPNTPIICNGFKDAEFIEMAMLAKKIGRHIIPVVEKYTELELILKYAEKLEVRPDIGIRVKLASKGSGRWQASGGYRSKFGLTVGEILKAHNELKSRNMLDCFKLLHFHLGSQITNIRQIKSAINEGIRIYVDLAKKGAGLQYLDVGGGLGVDYDGSQTNFESSINYTLQEYANDVVYQVMNVCDENSVAHPTIITESGRAIAAYHSVLVFGTLGVAEQGVNAKEIPREIPQEYEQPLHDLLLTYNEVNPRNMLESFHDAQQALETSMNLFTTGYLSLEQRVIGENLFFAISNKIRKLMKESDEVPDDLGGLDRAMSDSYFCNFSLFQSMPDSWAIKQLFPIMPIHKLKLKPTRHAVICDITCDSDGKVDSFIDRRDIRKTLQLHEFDGSPYLLGAFLIGAYQEILGDLHNLFGDTNAVHVEINDNGEVILESIIKGETVNDVLDYVQINGRELINRMQMAVELAVREGRLDNLQAGRFVKYYEDSLNGYTYLEEPQE